MYGRDIETLNIYVKQRGSLGDPLWTESGDKGNKWIGEEITIIATADFNV